MATKDTGSTEVVWNRDPSWTEFILSMEPLFYRLAAKYTPDYHLREDAVQNALVELLQQFPETTRAYDKYRYGEVTEEEWQSSLKAFCVTVARNEILSTLSSHTTGNMYTGRTEKIYTKDEHGNRRIVKRHKPARYVSLDALVNEVGIEVTDDYEVWWTGTMPRFNMGEDDASEE